MKTTLFFLACILSLALLSACAPSPTPTPLPTLTPQPTATFTQTATATSTATPTATATATNTPTPLPTATATPTAVPSTPTVKPSSTLEPSPTKVSELNIFPQPVEAPGLGLVDLNKAITDMQNVPADQALHGHAVEVNNFNESGIGKMGVEFSEVKFSNSGTDVETLGGGMIWVNDSLTGKNDTIIKFLATEKIPIRLIKNVNGDVRIVKVADMSYSDWLKFKSAVKKFYLIGNDTTRITGTLRLSGDVANSTGNGIGILIK